MRVFSTLLRNLFLASILLFCSCQSEPEQSITIELFGSLLMNEAVDEVIVVTDKSKVEVYLDEEKAKGLDDSFGLEEGKLLVIESVDKEQFLKKFDELVRLANLAIPPDVVFDE